jgi:hypothetical protein
MLPSRVMLRSALLLLAFATVACSSLTRPDDIKIYAEPLPVAVKPATPPVPAPVPRGAMGGAQAAPARPAAAAPANCGG